MTFTLRELEMLRNSLEYMMSNIRNCTSYASYEQKCEILEETRSLKLKIGATIKEVKNGGDHESTTE